MKNIMPIVVAVLVVVLCVSEESLALRGGRGGGGRGGGVSRGGGGARPSMSRSPSMSRAPTHSRPQVQRPQSPRPTRPAPRPAAQRPSTRPQPHRGFLDPPASRPSSRPAATRPATRPGQVPRPGGSNRPPSREQIKANIGNHPGQRPNMPSWFESGASTLPAKRPGGGASTLPGKRPGNDRPVARPNRPTNNRPGVRAPAARPLHVGNRPIAPGHIRPWHPHHPGHGHHRPGYWWRPATAVGLTAWAVARWNQPIYYSYGTGGSVYYEGDAVYVDGEQYGTAEQYYDEASTIAASAPEITEESAEAMEWLPLGVFALTGDGVGASQMYLQLAINKNSVISGTFYNETTSVTYEVEGYVDAKTQRAAWYAPDSKNSDLVMETGVYNLTEDEADALVHFGPDRTQTWKMVRLAESDRPAELDQPSE